MRTMLMAAVLVVVGCKSAEEKECNNASATPKDRVQACKQECDRGNDKACATQTQVATEACMAKKEAEVCRYMCLYGKTGKDLYCAEFKQQTGKGVDDL